jgi:hypothetical protein
VRGTSLSFVSIWASLSETNNIGCGGIDSGARGMNYDIKEIEPNVCV